MMKFCGKQVVGEFCRGVSLSRPDGTVWEMEIRPLPLSLQRAWRERGILQPTAPTKVSRDSQGRVLRDGDGLAVLQRDESAAEYLLEMEKYHQRVAVLVVWECLRGDVRYEFETPVPSSRESWVSFADAFHEELEQAGWSSGDVIWFCDRVAELSHLAGDHVQESRAGFF